MTTHAPHLVVKHHGIHSTQPWITARKAAGWNCTDGGWFAHDGTPLSEWLIEGLPLPESPEYAEWFTAYYHYEALDNDISPNALNPYPYRNQ